MSAHRSRRSRASICYKEHDSLLEDIKDEVVPTPSTPGKSGRGRRKSKVPKDKSFRMSESSQSDSSDVSPIDTKPQLLEDSNKVTTPKKRTRKDIEQVTPRRGIRVRRKTATVEDVKQTSNKLQQLNVDSSDDSDAELLPEMPEKPTSLFTEDDVEGKKMFGFQHRKHNLLKIATEALMESPKTPINKLLNSPRTPKSALKSGSNTPKKGRVSIVGTPKNVKFVMNSNKTPHSIRNKMKKELENLAQSDSEGSDFSASSSSDYQPDESEESDNASDKSSSEASEEEESTKASAKKSQSQSKPLPKSNYKHRGGKDNNFIVKPDDYFTMHHNKKVVTSNRTLDRLKNPRLTEDKLQDILKGYIISKEHKNSVKELMEDYKQLFDKWCFILSEGFSVLLHGVGSKIKLIQEFQKSKLSTYPCVVINGFFPSLTLKDVLDSIISDMLEMPSVPSNIYDAVSLIENEMATIPNTHLFIIIHNLDGPMLKNSKFQYVLSKIARIENFHLLASVDHINSPLCWDHMKLKDYNFSWWDVTNFLPYTQETSYETSLLVHKSGALAFSSLKNVFNSLTKNAKGIFMIIVKNQLKNKKVAHYQGISFKELYWSARESFLVSSDLALRAQLTEFIDHKLVKNKRTVDGVENLIIPMDNVLLEQFVEENEE